MSAAHGDFGEPEPPVWARREYAWPLSILIGFAATWVGLQLPVPGFAALLAAGAIAPLYMRFLDRGELPFATYIGLGWLLGSGAAGVGMALEGDLDRVLAALPHGRIAAQRWIEPWIGARPDFGGPAAGAVSYAVVLGGALFALALAPIARGVLMLWVLALGAGCLTGVAATYADAAAREGEAPLSAWAWGWPPLASLGLAGILWAGTSLAQPAGRGETRQRVWALGLGLPLAFACLALQLLWIESWARWAAGRLLG